MAKRKTAKKRSLRRTKRVRRKRKSVSKSKKRPKRPRKRRKISKSSKKQPSIHTRFFAKMSACRCPVGPWISYKIAKRHPRIPLRNNLKKVSQDLKTHPLASMKSMV